MDQRSESSRTFETEIPGVFRTELSTSVLHYLDEGQWTPIDTTLQEGSAGFATTATEAEMSVAEVADDDLLAGVELETGEAVHFAIEGAAAVEPEVDGERAVFEGVQPGVDLVIEAFPSGLKETLVLESASAPRTYTFPLSVSGLSGAVQLDGSVVFTDAAGSPRLSIPPGVMEDSSSDPVTGLPASSDGVAYELVDGGETLAVTLDGAWLDDPARTYPVFVDPTLSIWSDADDTYVSDGLTANNSEQYVLKVGNSGSRAHRAFMHFSGLDALSGMTILEADLAMYANGSGSCTPTPVDVFETTTSWAGSATTTFPGPALGTDLLGTIMSGLGHDSSCPGGFATTDLTRAVEDWSARGLTQTGIGLVARDESDPNAFKQYGSRESYVPPTLNVLWADPTLASAPEVSTEVTPSGAVASGPLTVSARYHDPEADAGQVVFFSYDAITGRFLGAALSATVAAGEVASYEEPGGLPLDYPLVYRALAVDTAHSASSEVSEYLSLVRPSVRVSSPANDSYVDGDVTMSAVVDPSATGVSAVEFLVDGAVVFQDTAAPYTVTGPSSGTPDGPHSISTRIVGGSADGVVSPAVEVYVNNGAPGAVERNIEVTPESAAELVANLEPEQEASTLSNLSCAVTESSESKKKTFIGPDPAGTGTWDVPLRCGSATGSTGARWGLRRLRSTTVFDGNLWANHARQIRDTIRCLNPAFPNNPAANCSGPRQQGTGSTRYEYSADFETVAGARLRFRVVANRRVCCGNIDGRGIKSVEVDRINGRPYGDLIGVNTEAFSFDDGHQEGPAVIMDRLQQNGVRHARESFLWNVIGAPANSASNPSDNGDWTSPDRLMEQAAINNVQILPLLTGSPHWSHAAHDPDDNLDSCRPPDADHYDEFALFAAAVVDRYDAGSPFWNTIEAGVTPRPIEAVAVWNEPYYNFNHPCSADLEESSANEFARMAVPALQAIEAENPSILKLFPIKQPKPPVNDDRVWSCDLFQAGTGQTRKCDEPGWNLGWRWLQLRDLVDVWAVHPYENVLEPRFGIDPINPEERFSGAEDMRNKLIEQGFRDRSGVNPVLWLTEFGWKRSQMVEAPQADSTIAAIRYARDHWPWLHRFYLYSYKNPAGDPWSVRRGSAPEEDRLVWDCMGELISGTHTVSGCP